MKLSIYDFQVESRWRPKRSYVYSDADVRLRKAIYPWAGKTEKEKSKKPESDALTDHMEAVLAQTSFLKPHSRQAQLKQDIWI